MLAYGQKSRRIAGCVAIEAESHGLEIDLSSLGAMSTMVPTLPLPLGEPVSRLVYAFRLFAFLLDIKDVNICEKPSTSKAVNFPEKGARKHPTFSPFFTICDYSSSNQTELAKFAAIADMKEKAISRCAMFWIAKVFIWVGLVMCLLPGKRCFWFFPARGMNLVVGIRDTSKISSKISPSRKFLRWRFVLQKLICWLLLIARVLAISASGDWW
ncbi:hypothetical protein L1987_80866 [Smallanthus sonchifolius]|uniref:Uncharacterized protein n=1 Tax=Smallanthus sonchifolius TaxID=185202 RepID=A0ACB8YPF5_9ASTR|nr:hypothetical protein L1987_80866 [Smallanthus sonchifolius]